MGTFNVLHTALKCPRCGVTVETAVDCHFGATGQMLDLKIGDRYPWVERKHQENGGRPNGGTVDGEGYMECPHCHKDAFLRVLIRDDVIVGVEPDTKKPGHIPD